MATKKSQIKPKPYKEPVQAWGFDILVDMVVVIKERLADYPCVCVEHGDKEVCDSCDVCQAYRHAEQLIRRIEKITQRRIE